MAMITPTDAQGRGYAFTIGANSFYAGLFDFDPIKWPGIVYPALLLKKGSDWELIKQFDTLWEDIQKDIDVETLAGLIIKSFNETLKKYSEGGEMSVIDKLAFIFQMRLALVKDQLVIKAA